MSDITVTIRLDSPDLALTRTVARADAATVQPVAGAGTVPNLGAYLFTVQTDDFDRFEAALTRDPTIGSFERIVDRGTEALYRFEYASDATVFSAAIADVNGISLDWTNDGAAWIVRVWLPDREALASLREFASDRGIEFSLERVGDYTTLAGDEPDLTEKQREALLVALEMGYFEEPRSAPLDDVAAELGISQPAAGGLLRRGIERLVVSTVAEDSDEPGRAGEG
jgi:predicted DNA binding protein